MPNTEPELSPARKTVHVCVAVIKSGEHILISRRPEHVHQGGLWEFPGGKVEANESVEQALQREIREELGLKISVSRPLIKIEHHYTDKSVCLDTWLVEDFNRQTYPLGQVSTGSEGQAVQWVKIQQLQNYDFPAANKAIINALQLPVVYAISPDSNEAEDAEFFQWLDNACQATGLIQLRMKLLKGQALEQRVKRVLEFMPDSKTRIMANSSMSLSEPKLKKFSGLHLTSEHLFDDSFIHQYKQRFPEQLMSASCHNPQEIERANVLKLDFITISPVKQTQSHPDADPLGWESFKQLCSLATMPVYALGGMINKDIDLAIQSGAQGIAGIRHITSNI